MLASYTFNKQFHQPSQFDQGLPNLRLLEGEEIQPAQLAPVMIQEYNQVRLRYFSWGLVPSWSRDDSMGKSRTLAPASNIFQRPSFQSAIRRQRCLIPADSYSLQKDIVLGSTTYELSQVQKPLFCFAGIYDCWHDAKGQPFHSFAIITAQAPGSMSQFGRQLPLILPRHQEKTWLNPDTNLTHIARLMQAVPDYKMEVEILHSKLETGSLKREIAA